MKKKHMMCLMTWGLRVRYARWLLCVFQRIKPLLSRKYTCFVMRSKWGKGNKHCWGENVVFWDKCRMHRKNYLSYICALCALNLRILRIRCLHKMCAGVCWGKKGRTLFLAQGWCQMKLTLVFAHGVQSILTDVCQGNKTDVLAQGVWSSSLH